MSDIERRKSAEALHIKANDRFHNSALGMKTTARELRSGAEHMADSNDRDAMLRLAAAYERRAGDVERRPTIRPLS
jgi:hypothetical protein